MIDFLANFRTRRLLCQTLVSLSEREELAVGSSDYDELIDVLERKDRVLTRLREGQDAIDAWRSNREALAAGERKACEALLAECEADLISVRQRTENASRRLTDRRSATIDLIRRVAAGQQTHREYHAEAELSTPPRRLDLTR